jgi:hypothetical protein
VPAANPVRLDAVDDPSLHAYVNDVNPYAPVIDMEPSEAVEDDACVISPGIIETFADGVWMAHAHILPKVLEYALSPYTKPYSLKQIPFSVEDDVLFLVTEYKEEVQEASAAPLST